MQGTSQQSVKNLIKDTVFPLSLILILISAIFYFDQWVATGVDTGFFLDLMFLYSKGKRFFIDYTDYRIPVFAIFFSWIYKFNLDEVARKYLFHISLYSFYAFSLFLILRRIFKSGVLSFFSTAVCILSLSSRSFDICRNAEVPLFYHTLELISGYLVLLALTLHNSDLRKKNFYATASGLLAGLAFIGRQNHNFLLAFSFIIPFIGTCYKSNLKIFVVFWLATVASIGTVLLIFFVPHVSFFQQMHLNLLQAPSALYPVKFSLALLWKNLIGSLFGFVQAWDLTLPIFILALSMFVALLLLKICRFQHLKLFFKENAFHWCMLGILSGIMLANIFLSGSAPARYCAPMFSLAAYLLAFSVAKFSGKFRLLFIAVALAITVNPMISFFTAETNFIQLTKEQSTPTMFLVRVGKAVREANPNNNNPLLLTLGGTPVICRTINCQPFMGFVSDVQLFLNTEASGDSLIREFKSKLSQVNIAVTLPDYPNVYGNLSRELSRYIDGELKRNFEIVTEIEPNSTYPYHFSKGATVYRRKSLN